MNIITTNAPVSFGTIAGILGAAWVVVIDNGLLDGLSEQGRASVTALVLLIIPVVAAFIAERFTTPTVQPTLEIGTKVNTTSQDLPNATVVADPE